MLLREALVIVASSKLRRERKIALLCGFEALHLKTYLQAMLAVAFPGDAPEVITYGFDQLLRGLEDTSTDLKASPVLLCLSWEDINPRLSWRSRGRLEAPTPEELASLAGLLKERLERWIEAREGAETCVALPPLEWLPLVDASPSFALGPTATAAQVWIWRIAEALDRRKAKLLRVEPADFNYRDLLQAGFPLSIEQSEILARRFVAACCHPQERKKVLVTDLDGTLWHGVSGEEGLAGIEWAAEGRGFFFHTFQRFLAKLKTEGTLLAFCSKNSPKDVLPIFDSLDMPLKLSDFAAYRCNWETKSENLRSIAQELHVGQDALVIIDDNEAELAEIQAHAPQVIRLRTPREGKEWQDFFRCVQDLFGTWRVSAEDQSRTESFLHERRRKTFVPVIQTVVGELSHLQGLELDISINHDAFADPRSLELINKTNQFNLTGERVSREQWLSWSTSPGAFCLLTRLKDRFGDFGAICVLVGAKHIGGFEVRQFVLSCRAFGRGVEFLVFGDLIQTAACDWVSGFFKDTGKNEPARRFLAALGAAPGPDGRWRLNRVALQEVAARVLKETDARVCRSSNQRVGVPYGG